MYVCLPVFCHCSFENSIAQVATESTDSIFMYPGDAIYFNSSSPHALTAVKGKSAQFIAVVIKEYEDQNTSVEGE